MQGATAIQKRIQEKYDEIAQLRKQQVEISKSEGLREVSSYSFKDKKGEDKTLHDLFEHHDELIVIHNMGKSCPYCTLWADGLSSSTYHIQNRCAIVLISPDDWETMYQFGEPREWEFPFVSAYGTTFIQDMNFSYPREDGKIQYIPGFTTFVKKEGKVYRVACDVFGPGDFYSPIWHFNEMLYHSDKAWSPMIKYE